MCVINFAQVLKYSREDLLDSEGAKDGSTRKGNIKAMGQLNERSLAIADVVKEIAKEVDRSPSQVSLNWLVQQPGKPIPIIGARKVSHLEDNIGALDFTLSAEQIDRLNKASSFAMPFPYSFIKGDSPMSVSVMDGQTSIESGFSVYK
jgi:aryl-alcohol dehydrogenase-like predicted oxidoreductase